jgi:hypothetical protein
MERDRATPREDPHSLAPVQLEIQTIDEDIAQLKRGRAMRLLWTTLLSGLAVFGVVQWLENVDGSAAYAAAAERLEAINAQQGNAFLRCVLPDMQKSQLATRNSLHTALEVASERSQKHYGKQLKRCAALSDAMIQRLNDLEVPTDMYGGIQGVRSAAGDLQQALGAYQAYLLDPTKPYDFVQATPMIERISIAWRKYETRRDEFNANLRDHP